MSLELEPKWRSFLTITEIVLTPLNLLLESTAEQKRTNTKYCSEKYALLQYKSVLSKCTLKVFGWIHANFGVLKVPNSTLKPKLIPRKFDLVVSTL